MAVVSQWLFTFLVVEITPPMITNIGYKSYIVFAVINLVTIPCVYFFYPETLKMPLEAVDLLFADRDGSRPSIFRVVKDSTNREFKASLEKALQERAMLRAANEGIVDMSKGQAEHLEV